uniref:Uncharacterized protein n=1 Tax=Chloropicon laureae TaxID=464258 RepID=A0A7S2Z1W9_9CHLO
MEPARAVAELHHAVARGLTGDLQRDHGQRNLLGQLNQCGDLLAASAESAEAVRRTSFGLREAAAAEEAREDGGVEGRAAQLRAKLSHALEIEEESKKTLSELENKYIAKRLELQNEIHSKIKGQEAMHLKMSSGILK